MPPRRTRLLLLRTVLSQGGGDRVTISLLRGLDREQFDITLALMKRTGEYLEDVPADIPIHDLHARSLWRIVPPLVRALRELKPDVVFSLDSGANVPTVIAHRLARSRARLVLSERNILWNGGRTRKRAFEIALKRVFYPLADVVTTVSDGVAEDLVQRLHLSRDKIAAVYNPMVDASIDRLAAEPVAHPWFAEPTPIILACGRLVPQKDYPTLFRAFDKVRARHDARLVILGDGPLRGELEAEVARMGLAPHVHFVGFDKNPFKYLAKGSVFVLSSKNEGLPGALIQAMACGLPPVSTDCPAGPNEIISRPGENGFLVPIGDADAIADRICRLLAEPQLRATMGARARQAVQRFRAEESLGNYVAALLGPAEARQA